MDIRSEPDIERLRAVTVLQSSWIEHLTAQLEQKCREIDELKGVEGDFQATLDIAEKAVADALGQSAPPDKPEKEKKPRKPREKFGATPQPKLEQETMKCVLDEPDMTCPSCGGELKPFAGQSDVSELIDVTEVTYRLIRVEQQKYVCRCGGCVETAPGPVRMADGGRYSVAFGAKVVTDKYVHHIPLARQVRIMAGHGLTVTSQTLWDQVYASAELLRATWIALRLQILACGVIGLDQTGWPSLHDKKAKPWQMWALTAPRMVWHGIRDDKSAATFVDLVGRFDGVVVCDALKTHGAGARASPGIKLAGCWAHVRRKFADARDKWPEAQVALDYIRALYDIDKKATDDAELLALRQTEPKAVLANFKKWLLSQRTLPRSAFGKAVRYPLENWARLTLFVDDVRVPLDNNATERGLRGPVVGRRNHHGSKSRRGTEAASILYSLAETAKLCGVEPLTYFDEAIRQARLNPGVVFFPWEMLDHP